MKNITVNYQNKPCYDIKIRNDFSELAASIKAAASKSYGRVCVVTDSNVEKLYLEDVKSALAKEFETVISFAFEAGEPSKNIMTVQSLWEQLVLNRFDRNDLLVALGGGVVGDLTGFSASTYMRGIDFVQVPTTLLSCVDSSIGGKTGVDFLAYKNMVGAFYMPRLVYMNITTLKSLDDAQFACGMGEVIKHGLIKDIAYLDYLKKNKDAILAKDDEALEEIVYGSCQIKRMVVEEDPTEQGIRAHLNFGHTIGHAVEKMSDFKLFHGQCVAIGMVAALLLSKKLGYIADEEIDDIKELLLAYNLPVLASDINSADVLKATKSDKKAVGSKVKFVVLNRIGNADIYRDFSDEDLLSAIEEVIK